MSHEKSKYVDALVDGSALLNEKCGLILKDTYADGISLCRVLRKNSYCGFIITYDVRDGGLSFGLVPPDFSSLDDLERQLGAREICWKNSSDIFKEVTGSENGWYELGELTSLTLIFWHKARRMKEKTHLMCEYILANIGAEYFMEGRPKGLSG